VVKTLHGAMDKGLLPVVDPQHIIVFDGVEVVKSDSKHWYIRWPLYLYEQLKAAFPSPYSGSTGLDENNILTLNVNVHV